MDNMIKVSLHLTQWNYSERRALDDPGTASDRTVLIPEP